MRLSLVGSAVFGHIPLKFACHSPHGQVHELVHPRSSCPASSTGTCKGLFLETSERATAGRLPRH